MKTLESILQGVTPPETWHVCKDHGNNYAIMPDKDSYIALAQYLCKRDADLILRATRNFAPLVRALQAAQRLDYLREHNALAKMVDNAINQALADEP